MKIEPRYRLDTSSSNSFSYIKTWTTSKCLLLYLLTNSHPRIFYFLLFLLESIENLAVLNFLFNCLNNFFIFEVL